MHCGKASSQPNSFSAATVEGMPRRFDIFTSALSEATIEKYIAGDNVVESKKL